MSVIAWLDLETTGLEVDSALASILEIGILFSDENMVVLETFQLAVNPALDKRKRTFINEYDLPETLPEDVYLDRLIDRLDPVVREMHTANGLWDDVRKSYCTPHGADLLLKQTLEAVKKKYGTNDKIVLAGSGVGHYDSPWIKKHLPESSKLLEHRGYDNGYMRRFLKDVVGYDTSLGDPSGLSSGNAKSHRALDDAKAHFVEAKYYRNVLKLGLLVQSSA